MYVFLGALYVLLQVFFLFDDLNHMLRYLEDYFIRNPLVQKKYRGRAHKFMQDVCAHVHIYTYTCAHTRVQLDVNHPLSPSGWTAMLINRTCHRNLILTCSETQFWCKYKFCRVMECVKPLTNECLMTVKKT